MLSSQEIFEGKIAEKLNENVEKVRSIGCIYEFELLGEKPEQWTIDLTRENNFVSAGSTGQAHCTVSISLDVLNELIEKKLSPQMAFLTGKLKVKGNMGLALKLGAFL